MWKCHLEATAIITRFIKNQLTGRFPSPRFPGGIRGRGEAGACRGGGRARRLAPGERARSRLEARGTRPRPGCLRDTALAAARAALRAQSSLRSEETLARGAEPGRQLGNELLINPH